VQLIWHNQDQLDEIEFNSDFEIYR